MKRKKKVTVSDFIRMKQMQLFELQCKKKPKDKGATEEFMYLCGMIDAAKLIRKTFQLAAIFVVIALSVGEDFTVNNPNGSQQVCNESQGTITCR